MAFNFGKIANPFAGRDWIKKNEGKLTYVQFFGFVLITLGIIYFASFLMPSGLTDNLDFLKIDGETEGSKVSIAFFTVMLGIAFAFPDMLQGQTKEISTMRIIVFMFANVICMLLLKIGWSKGSLHDIGLDGFWMGVIAFLFGAKATQSYFENAKTFFPGPEAAPSTRLTKSEIARIAVEQNRDELLARHPNIESVSDTLKNGESSVTIYVKDNHTDTIPKEVTATLKDLTVVKVPTEIISDSGEATPHIGQATDHLSDVDNPNFLGSVCCLVDSTTNPGFKGIVTSGHVFTEGDFLNYGGVLSQQQRRDTLINGIPKASLFFQQMKYNQDIAITELIDKTNLMDNYISFERGFYEVSESDFNAAAANVTIVSKGNNKRDAYILDFNVSFDIYYKTPRNIRNIILIGTTSDRATSQTVSEPGDSGSCVYHKESKKLIGMLLGGNKKFSFVLPLEETLNSFNFKVL